MKKKNQRFLSSLLLLAVHAAGYVAPRHMQAIHSTNNQLIAAMDKFDSVGILDRYFPNTHFFTEFERFDRHIDKLRRKGTPIDYLSICTPNYLHDAHIRFGLRSQADVICEKPLVLNPWNVEALATIEKETDRSIFTILQLRHHPSIIALKAQIEKENNNRKKYDIDLTYITSRGNWYQQSWKGDLTKSGGVATNIGIHFFDMLLWIFGQVRKTNVHIHQAEKAAGFLELEHARVRWYLSINEEDLPTTIKQKGQRTYRSITVDGSDMEFSNGFTDLHTVSYSEILKGNGFGISDAQATIQLVHDIRNSVPIGRHGDYHSLAFH